MLVINSSWAEPPLYDNRFKPVKVGEPLPDDVPDNFLTEGELFETIASFRNADLSAAMDKRLILRWQRRIALRDADYFLCVFDASVRLEPGHNPRVLVLFTPAYELKAWGSFVCEPRFEAGCVVNPWEQPNTYFVTMNQSGRNGGGISFEKYIVAAEGIRRLGEGNELGKISDGP